MKITWEQPPAEPTGALPLKSVQVFHDNAYIETQEGKKFQIKVDFERVIQIVALP